ncbi:hypothetical protein DOS84_11705 [Flavobacterium aquariorum]|uniref:Uncharacterized protein n=1 Tax=Flavobacterium aquariorum TaxID=2217670 RepID=A0A2W7TSJ0_9FLAO|nr:hypothetical protein [Flavobacterium aquariorum]PZX93028.1 hypothetical protein DOS84_11705 [Flavobacterium aquariorum]
MILKRILFFILLFFATTLGYSQSFNVEQLAKTKLINVSGGASANAIMYSGNAAREPFSYFFNGNININVAGLYNLPFSFSYSTQKFGYTKPVAIKTLSIHPSYKWITTHIGDVNMTFSPYTLNGHLFTGFGVDLTPPGKFKVSAMYGRLLKSNEYDVNIPEAIPTYKRFGYGFKTAYAFDKVNLGLIFFKATDVTSSLSNPVPFELGLTPKENVAVSFETSFKLFQKLQVMTEYANSSITEDISIEGTTKGKGIASLFLNPNATTTSQNAIKAQLVYPAGKGTLGLGYERIDPNYRTLGSYYFNNDLENITVNATQQIFKDKVSLALSLGMQKDNLDKQKVSQSKRLVSSLTADYKANQKLNLNFNYSNFQSYTNSRNQFDYINQDPSLIYADTLNFRQVNQNLGLTANYLLKNDKQLKKSINVNFSMQESSNEQQGQTVAGGETTFYNSAISYVQGYPTKDLNFMGSINNTYSLMETGNSLIIGPTLGVTKLFMERKLNTSFSTSYNTTFSNGDKQNDIFNMRLSSSYLYLEKHNFNLGVICLFGKTTSNRNNDLTATLTYAYSFDKIKLRSTPKEQKKEERQLGDNTLKINLKDYKLEGTREQITQQLKDLQQQLQPLPNEEASKLEHLLTLATLTPDEASFKDKVIDYLEEYQAASEVIKKYNKLIGQTVQKVAQEISNKDESFEKAYTTAISRVNSHKLHGVNPSEITDKVGYNSYLKLIERSDKAKQKLQAHRFMQTEFLKLSKADTKEMEQNDYLLSYNKKEIEKVYKLITNKKTDAEIIAQLEQNLIPFYHELALANGMNEEVELKYIQK